MNINIFNGNSPLHPFRWFILSFLIMAGTMVFHDLTGRRIFDYSKQQQWNRTGPGYHK